MLSCECSERLTGGERAYKYHLAKYKKNGVHSGGVKFKLQKKETGYSEYFMIKYYGGENFPRTYKQGSAREKKSH